LIKGGSEESPPGHRVKIKQTSAGAVKSIKDFLSPGKILINDQSLAEGEGFEPPVGFPTTVFKTVALDRSAIPPEPVGFFPRRQNSTIFASRKAPGIDHLPVKKNTESPCTTSIYVAAMNQKSTCT
jgi:hypothetical protein